MRISDWSSDVCSSDLRIAQAWIPESWLVVIMYLSKPISRWLWSRWWSRLLIRVAAGWHALGALLLIFATPAAADPSGGGGASPFFAWMALKDTHGIDAWRSEEHTSELQSLMRISYAVFCLKKKRNTRDRE